MAAMVMGLTSEAKTEDVGGRVIDVQGEPLPFVSVVLLTGDSTYVQGTTSDLDGFFQLKTTDACCILRFSYIGYRTKYVNVKGSEIGTIQMEEDQSMLSEIIVKGQLPKTKLTGNSMVTSIQGTILSQSGTAQEMLAKVPGMTAKGEELEVLGKGTPVIYINGRKMHDKEELKRLRSEEIASPTFGIWSPNWTVGGQKFWNTMEFDEPRSVTGQVKETYTKPIFFIDQNNAFRLPHRWQLEVNMNIMTKGDVINFHMVSASYRLGFLVQKCWLKNDALCLRASINDVLQRSVQDMRMSCGAYHWTENAVRSNHRLNVSLRYTFNASKSKYKGTGAGQAERQRM